MQRLGLEVQFIKQFVNLGFKNGASVWPMNVKWLSRSFSRHHNHFSIGPRMELQFVNFSIFPVSNMVIFFTVLVPSVMLARRMYPVIFIQVIFGFMMGFL